MPGHPSNVMKPINGDKAKVRGMEIGFQHLWDNGFGVQAQYAAAPLAGWAARSVRWKASRRRPPPLGLL